MAPHVVAVAMTDGLPLFELSVPVEVFGRDRSDIVSPWYDLRLCAAHPGPIRTSGGLTAAPAYGLDALPQADTVLIPACPRPIQVDPPAPLVAAVRAAHAAGRRIVSLCTGAYVLAAAGILDGRRATTHWLNAHDLAYRYPAVQVDPRVEMTDDSVEHIARRAGFGTSASLRQHFGRMISVSPQSYRHVFRHRSRAAVGGQR
jgi:transcriptional regulator GlxA family with amidase domain